MYKLVSFINNKAKFSFKIAQIGTNSLKDTNNCLEMSHPKVFLTFFKAKQTVVLISSSLRRGFVNLMTRSRQPYEGAWSTLWQRLVNLMTKRGAPYVRACTFLLYKGFELLSECYELRYGKLFGT